MGRGDAGCSRNLGHIQDDSPVGLEVRALMRQPHPSASPRRGDKWYLDDVSSPSPAKALALARARPGRLCSRRSRAELSHKRPPNACSACFWRDDANGPISTRRPWGLSGMTAKRRRSVAGPPLFGIFLCDEPSLRQSSAELKKLQAAFHWRGLPAILPSTFMATMALVSAPATSRCAEGVAKLIFWPVDVPAREDRRDLRG